MLQALKTARTFELRKIKRRITQLATQGQGRQQQVAAAAAAAAAGVEAAASTPGKGKGRGGGGEAGGSEREKLDAQLEVAKAMDLEPIAVQVRRGLRSRVLP